MEIDWNEAPEWAVAHAFYTFVNQITPVWVGVDQWQDVVRGKPFPYGGGVGEARHNPTRAQFQYETPRPAPWTGEGLPPVGTVCERNIARSAWCKTTILAVTPEGRNVAYQDAAGRLGWSGCESSAMNRASPARLRQALEVAHALTKAGIGFVCMPVCDEADYANLADQAAERLERIATVIEVKERNHVKA